MNDKYSNDGGSNKRYYLQLYLCDSQVRARFTARHARASLQKALNEYYVRNNAFDKLRQEVGPIFGGNAGFETRDSYSAIEYSKHQVRVAFQRLRKLKIELIENENAIIKGGASLKDLIATRANLVKRIEEAKSAFERIKASNEANIQRASIIAEAQEELNRRIHSILGMVNQLIDGEWTDWPGTASPVLVSTIMVELLIRDILEAASQENVAGIYVPADLSQELARSARHNELHTALCDPEWELQYPAYLLQWLMTVVNSRLSEIGCSRRARVEMLGSAPAFRGTARISFI